MWEKIVEIEDSQRKGSICTIGVPAETKTMEQGSYWNHCKILVAISRKRRKKTL